MDVMDVSFDVFSDALPWPQAHHHMVMRHRPTGTVVEADWSDGEDTQTAMREKLIGQLEELLNV